MEKNPYKSPKSESEIDEQARKPSRVLGTVICSVATFAGLCLLQGYLTGIPTPYLSSEPGYRLLFFLLIPSVGSLAMATWAWRSPKSIWPAAIAGLVWFCSLLIWFIGPLLYFLL